MNETTAAARQLAARHAAFDAIDRAERHIALLGDRITAAQLERLADGILGLESPTARQQAALEEARQAKARQAQANRIDHWARRQDVPAVRADVVLAGRLVTDLVADALAPAARRSQSRAERAEATRLADKTRVRKSSHGKRADNAALKAQRQRMADIAAGRAQVTAFAAWVVA